MLEPSRLEPDHTMRASIVLVGGDMPRQPSCPPSRPGGDGVDVMSQDITDNQLDVVDRQACVIRRRRR